MVARVSLFVVQCDPTTECVFDIIKGLMMDTLMFLQMSTVKRVTYRRKYSRRLRRLGSLYTCRRIWVRGGKFVCGI